MTIISSRCYICNTCNFCNF